MSGRDDVKLQVREASDIVEVIGAHVQLKKAGRSWKGLCPFHPEKTPSFHVNAERQTFKCFGCGEGGDVFSFVEKHERVEFREALAILAERAGISIETSPEQARQADVERQRKLHLFKAQELAARFFRERLDGADGLSAREYLERRKLGHLARDWGLGFAPDRWDGLVSRIATTPARERLAVAAGLARARETGGVYDYFRNRLMFPIAEGSGRLVGFGGRVIGEGEPKYLNSPDSAIFSKGRLLYGLDRAKETIARTAAALVVEGYTDVIRCHEHGFANAVATLGTALGAEHIRLLRRYGAERVLVTYDADAAGLKAAERGLEVLIEEDMPASVVVLGDGLDPCDFIAERGAEAFGRAVDAAKDAFEFKIDRLMTGSVETLEARAKAAHSLMDVAARSGDPVRRALLKQRIAERLRLPEETLVFPDGAGSERNQAGPTRVQHEEEASALNLDRRAERDLAEALLRWPAGLELAAREADLGAIVDPVASAVIDALGAIAAEGGRFEERAILDRLGGASVGFAVHALEAEVKADRVEAAVLKTAVAVWKRQTVAVAAQLNEDISAAKAAGDAEKERELIAERARMTRALKRTRAQVDTETQRKMEEICKRVKTGRRAQP